MADGLTGDQIELKCVQGTYQRLSANETVRERAALMRAARLGGVDFSATSAENGDGDPTQDKATPFPFRDLAQVTQVVNSLCGG